VNTNLAIVLVFGFIGGMAISALVAVQVVYAIKRVKDILFGYTYDG
jgi:hypothetical protein